MSRKATLVNHLKTISSRLICKEFAEIVNLIYSKPAFWTKAYFVASCGGVTVEQARKYIEKRDPLIFLKEFKGSRSKYLSQIRDFFGKLFFLPKQLV